MSAPNPSVPNLEHLKKTAKRLLRACLDGDPEAIERLRGRLPRLDAHDVRIAADGIQLADVQQALAMEHGFENWAALKAAVEAAEPIEQKAERFLAAVREHAYDVARQLLKEHPAIAGHDIHTASAAYDAERVAAMLAADRSLATSVHAGSKFTPLLHLCASPLHARDPRLAAASSSCAALLLDHGASPNEYSLWESAHGSSPIPALYWACVSGNAPLARLLLERGAEPNDGESVYHAAEHDHRACLEVLLEHGAEISAVHPHHDNTPLYFLASHGPTHANAANVAAGLRWLLEHGADPNVRSYERSTHPGTQAGETPLHAAASRGHAAVVAMLLEHGADPNARRRDGRTPYVSAVRAGSVAVAETLRARGAGVATLDPADELIGACMRGDLDAARAVLAAHPGLLGQLGEGDRRALPHAAFIGNSAAVRIMVAVGFDVALEGTFGGTALHQAAWRGDVAMVRELLAAGAPVNVRDRSYGSSPLAWAGHGSHHCRSADDDYSAIIEMLIAAGSRPEFAVNRWGEAPDQLGSRRVGRLLRERGFTREKA